MGGAASKPIACSDSASPHSHLSSSLSLSTPTPSSSCSPSPARHALPCHHHHNHPLASQKDVLVVAEVETGTFASSRDALPLSPRRHRELAALQQRTLDNGMNGPSRKTGSGSTGGYFIQR